MTDWENIYKKTMAQSREMKRNISRRQMMKIMAATAATASMGYTARIASADTKGPGWDTDSSL